MNRRSMFKFLALAPLLAVGACKPKSIPPTAPPLPEKPEKGVDTYTFKGKLMSNGDVHIFIPEGIIKS